MLQEAELVVVAATEEAKKSVHTHLLDNLNTGGAIEALLELISITNKYMKQREAEKAASPTGIPPPHTHSQLRPPSRYTQPPGIRPQRAGQ